MVLTGRRSAISKRGEVAFMAGRGTVALRFLIPLVCGIVSCQKPVREDELFSLGVGDTAISVLAVDIDGSLGREETINALRHLLVTSQRMLADSIRSGNHPAGSCVLAVRTEPGGLVSWIGQMEKKLEGPATDAFIRDVCMQGMEWVFPKSSAETSIAISLRIGKK